MCAKTVHTGYACTVYLIKYVFSCTYTIRWNGNVDILTNFLSLSASKGTVSELPVQPMTKLSYNDIFVAVYSHAHTSYITYIDLNQSLVHFNQLASEKYGSVNLNIQFISLSVYNSLSHKLILSIFWEIPLISVDSTNETVVFLTDLSLKKC